MNSSNSSNSGKILEKQVVLVTLDSVMAIKAHCSGIRVEDVKDIKFDINRLYKGYRGIILPVELVEEMKNKKHISADRLPVPEEGFFENEFIVPNNNYKLLFRYNNGGFNFVCGHPKKIFDIGPRENNLPQVFSWNLLFDSGVNIVSLVGPAGTGKTFLSLVAALAQLKDLGVSDKEKAIYENIVIITPTANMAKDQDIGLLPGEKYEKICPWAQSVFDNIKVVRRSEGLSKEKSREFIERLRKDGVIEFENINFLRGRSISNSFIIVDEAQNFNQEEVKLIGSRAGQGSKIVLTGDPSQVSRYYLNKDNNGLVRAVESFKGHREAGAIYLDKVERSAVSRLFCEEY